MNIVQALKREHNRLVAKLEGIRAAITALGGKQRKAKRKMSAATRRKISATQRKNWAAKRKNGK